MVRIGMLFLATLPGGVAAQTRVVLPLGTNETLSIPSLKRAAVAEPKIARVRALPPDRLLLTARARGRTSLRAWDTSGRESAFEIDVVPAHWGRQSHGTGLARVALQFLELHETARREVGVRWPELVSATGSGLLQGGPGAALTYTVGMNSTRGWIQALVREGKARLLANPEIYVRLGEEATFSSGGEIPVATTSETFGRLQRHVEWKPYGISVKVRPESPDAFHLASDIQVDFSELNQAAAVGGVPALHTRKLTTKVNSLDGETILLSGLVRQIQSDQKDGVPVLSDLPVLGGLFSAGTQSRQLQEVLMALTLSVATRGRMQDRWEDFQSRFGEDK